MKLYIMLYIILLTIGYVYDCTLAFVTYKVLVSVVAPVFKLMIGRGKLTIVGPGRHDACTGRNEYISVMYICYAQSVHGFAHSRDCPAQTLDPWFVCACVTCISMYTNLYCSLKSVFKLGFYLQG